MPYKKIELIHRVMIVEGGDLPDNFPEVLIENIQSAESLYPHARQKIWGGKDIVSLIKENFDREVLNAYNALAPFAFKCDLSRYCLLYFFGGLYVDFGVKCVSPIQIPDTKSIMAFRDHNCLHSPSWTSLSQAVLWAEPKRPELSRAIDMIVENCQRKFYGKNPLYPTGPVLLGRAFVAHMAQQAQSEAADEQWIGMRPSAPEFITPDGALVALRNERQGGDFPNFGVRGTNNYNYFWFERMLYGESGGPTRGHLDVCLVQPDDRLRIAGWAQDAEQPDVSIGITVTVNETVIATCLADIFRPDLASASIGNGCHGFDFFVDTSFCSEGFADVRVIRSTTATLIGNTKSYLKTRKKSEVNKQKIKSQNATLPADELSILAEKLLPYITQRSLDVPNFQGDPNRLIIGVNVHLCNTHFNLVSGRVYIEDYVSFGQNVSVLTGTLSMDRFDRERQLSIPADGRDIYIERGAWIASNATVIGPCRIGKHAVVGAGSVVTANVEAGWLYAGVPARPIRPVCADFEADENGKNPVSVPPM